MPRPHPTQPDPDPDHFWPSCDHEPPGVSIQPLSHTDLQALLVHLDRRDHDERLLTRPGLRRPTPGQPMVAVRVRASVGRPGASAQAEYRRRRASERAAWTRSLPWRTAAALAAGAAAGLLATKLAPHLTALAAILAAVGLGWQLRFRPNSDIRAWRRGANGERRTARLLAPLERRGWAVLHDLAIPGSQANIDHLAIGPGGVLVIDSKQYRGRLRLDGDGMLWHGRHLLVSTLRTTRWEADQADEVLGIADIDVAAVVAIHGASVPWGQVQADGATVVPARRLPDLLQALPPIIGPERVAWLADRARLRFHSVPDSRLNRAPHARLLRPRHHQDGCLRALPPSISRASAHCSPRTIRVESRANGAASSVMASTVRRLLLMVSGRPRGGVSQTGSAGWRV